MQPVTGFQVSSVHSIAEGIITYRHGKAGLTSSPPTFARPNPFGCFDMAQMFYTIIMGNVNSRTAA